MHLAMFLLGEDYMDKGKHAVEVVVVFIFFHTVSYKTFIAMEGMERCIWLCFYLERKHAVEEVEI